MTPGGPCGYARGMAKKRIPVIVVAGFLGCGKTTLLNHLLRNNGGARIGVIVNDFGSINIDSMMVAGQVDSMVSLSNGCLCCAVDVSDMDVMLNRLAHRKSEIDVILVEASGLAEPRNLIRLVLASENRSISYGGLVLVVDAAEFLRTRTRHPELDRHVGLADLVLLNKTDRIGDADHDIVLAEVALLNGRAPVLSTTHGRIDPALLFDPPGRAEPGPGEQLTLDRLLYDGCDDAHRCGEHAHPHSSYDSIEFTSAAPLHPRRLVSFLERQPPGVYRIKGFVHFGVGGDTEKFVLQTVGDHVRFEPSRWSRGESRSTRLVVIGADLDLDAVRVRLDECVHTDAENVDRAAIMAVHRYTA